jgi:hypothetical protein
MQRMSTITFGVKVLLEKASSDKKGRSISDGLALMNLNLHTSNR